MRRIHFGLLTAALSMMVVSLVLSGCGGTKSEDDDEGSGPRKRSKSVKSGGGPKGATLTPVTAKEYGVIRGTVKWPGDKKPDFNDLTQKLQAGMVADRDYCLTGRKKDDPAGFKADIHDYETFQQGYRVGDNMGVGNVFVWIVPEAGHYFEVPPDQLAKFKDSEVVVSQPHCAFLPHASVLFPSYYKEGKLEPSGQKLIVENDARVSHNSKVQGGPVNPPKDQTLAPKDKNVYTVKPDKTPITVSCGIHTWMKGYLRAFDHPYAAVTSTGGDVKAKKYEDPKSPKYGTYEITGVPVGAKVRIVAWHEDMGFLAGDAGREITIKKEDVQDFDAKPK